MTQSDLLLICLILLITYCYYEPVTEYMTRRTICNDVDGRCYSMVSKFSNLKEGSETLARLNIFMIKLIRHMRKKYLWDQEKTEYYYRMSERLLNNYNPDAVIENNPKNKNYTSYVQDKGDVFGVCLREKRTGENALHQDEILKFVTMHEMAHLASVTNGHEEMEFWSNFKIILQNAVELKIYTPVDYAKHPVNYCSLHVDYNPYFDDDVPT